MTYIQAFLILVCVSFDLGIKIMGKESGDRRRRKSGSGGGRMLREVPGNAIVPAMWLPVTAADRPEWLPEGWTLELKKRSSSCLSSDRVDRYYICPLSGIRYRSRLEVMRLLNNETPIRPATYVHRATSSTLVVGQRPEWLPQRWSVEFRQRMHSSTIDKYYICPLSGKKLRSRLEVMRYLNNEMLGCPASGSSPSDECYKQLVEYPASPSDELYKPLAEYDHSPCGLPDGWIKETRFRKNCSKTDSYYIDPITGYGFRSKRDAVRYIENKEVCRIAFRQKRTHTPDTFTLKEEFFPIIELKKSKLKRNVARRRLFAREGPICNASTDIKFANPPQKPSSSSLGHSSALYNGASELSFLTPANVEPVEQGITEFLIEWQPNPEFHGEEFQGQPAIKILPCPGKEKLSLMELDGERLQVPDANLSEKKQFELTNKQSQPKKHSIGEELQEQTAIKIPLEPGNAKLLKPLMQLEGDMLPVPDANLSEGKQFVLTQKQTQPKRHSIEKELQGQSEIKVIHDPWNDKLSVPLLQLEGEILPVPDVNLSEEKQFELTEKLSQLKRCNRPKRHGIAGEIQGHASIEILSEPENKKLSVPLMQLEDERPPVPDVNLVEEKQFELSEKLSQLKKRIHPKRHGIGEELLGQLGSKIVRESENEKLLLPSMQVEGKMLPAPDTTQSEEQQFEMTETLSQFKRRSRGCPRSSKNAEAVKSVNNQPSLRKRKAKTAVTMPVRDAKQRKRKAEAAVIVPVQDAMQWKRKAEAAVIVPVQDAEQRKREAEEAVTVHVQDAKQQKRKAEEAVTVPFQDTKRLAGVIADPSNSGNGKQSRRAKTRKIEQIADPSNSGNGKQSRRAKTRKIEQTQPTVPKDSDASHEKNASITDGLQEKLESLKPFIEQASLDQQADHLQPAVPQPAVPKDSDASCWAHHQDTPITNELQEKFEQLKPFVEQASHDQKTDQPQSPVPNGLDAKCRLQQNDTPDTDEIQEKLKRLALFVEQAPKDHPIHPAPTLPFGDSWPDPCIEFAFKTLTSDFPVLEDIAAMQVYFNHQLISAQIPNPSPGLIPLPFDGPSSVNGKVNKDSHQNRGIAGKVNKDSHQNRGSIPFDSPSLVNGKVSEDSHQNRCQKL